MEDIVVKTELNAIRKAVFYRSKACRYGKRCTNVKCNYAHTLNELRPLKCTYDDKCIDKYCDRLHPDQSVPDLWKLSIDLHCQSLSDYYDSDYYPPIIRNESKYKYNDDRYQINLYHEKNYIPQRNNKQVNDDDYKQNSHRYYNQQNEQSERSERGEPDYIPLKNQPTKKRKLDDNVNLTINVTNRQQTADDFLQTIQNNLNNKNFNIGINGIDVIKAIAILNGNGIKINSITPN